MRLIGILRPPDSAEQRPVGEDPIRMSRQLDEQAELSGCQPKLIRR
jgi:hypothetical protein